MNYRHMAFIVLTAVLISACASRHTKTNDASAGTPAEQKTASDKDKKEAAKSKKEAAKSKDKDKKEAAAPSAEGEIIGKPAPGSKFAKLKIGMTLNQVVGLIGQPANQWTHPTAKASIPFYFGPDRWALEYSYKGEGVLTFNSGEAQALTRIEVNKAE